MPVLTATFDLDDWQEETIDDAAGARVFAITIQKTYRGDVEGRSVTRLLAASSDSAEDSAAYGGVERLEVSVQGREGTFVLRHAAVMSPDDRSMDVVVVPNTATNELVGLAGSAQIDVGDDGAHTITFDLDLPA